MKIIFPSQVCRYYRLSCPATPFARIEESFCLYSCGSWVFLCEEIIKQKELLHYIYKVYTLKSICYSE